MSEFAPVRLVIVDLDNTLYDWVGFFAPSFEAMVDAAVESMGVSREILLDDIRSVHQEYGNTEHPFALLETKTVRQRFGRDRPRSELKNLLQSAFDAFDTERLKRLQLYPSVADTLRTIQRQQTVVIGHTEAKSVNAWSRAKILGLEDLLDGIFTPEFEGLEYPGETTTCQRSNPSFIFELDPTAKKPDPEVAIRIAAEFGIETHNALYVGDSLTKDIAMANSAGMMSAWARYGTEHADGLWDTVVRVTHWTSAQASEEKLQASLETEPSITIDSFGDLLSHFDFQPTAT